MEFNHMNDSYLLENTLNSYHIQNSSDQSSQRSISPINGSRSRSRSFDTRSNERGYSRSRSPRNRNTNDNQREQHQDYTNDFNNRQSRRNNNETRNNRNQTNTKSTLTDKELGLKYRWEKTVFVSNIPYDVKWPELKDLFRSKIGDIHFCEIFEKDGKSMGVGSIEFKLLEDAEKAVELMNQYDLGTRKITVRMDSDGSRTRKSKEMSKDFSKQISNFNNQIQQDHQQAANLLASLNQANLLAALGLSNNTNSNLTSTPLQQQQPTTPVSPISSNSSSALNTPNIINLLTSLANANVTTTSTTAAAATTTNTSSNSNNLALLNQIAQQNKLEGSVTNRIFIASLDYKVDEYKIREVFNLAGKVQSVSLFKDRDGKSRGMSVVEYATPLEALNAVLMFNNQVLNNRTMNVRFDTKPPKEEESLSNNSSKLPSGLRSIGTGLGLNLNALQPKNSDTTLNPLATSLDALSALTAGINTQNANSVNSLGALAGLAGLTSANGNLGLSSLLGTLNTGIGKHTATTTISKIFIKNIPFSWDERKLKEKFRQAGPIEFVEIKHRDGKSRGCGLIKFSTPDQASKAVELFNGSRFEGRTLEVKLDQLSN